MNYDEFQHLISRIRLLGVDQDTACRYAERIGDTPEIDSGGLTVVRDDKQAVIARLAIDWGGNNG